jgi:uncharacterized protein YjbI with pentapeptide repeats
MTELGGADLSGALTDRAAGRAADTLDIPLDIRLDSHARWIASSSADGVQLDLSGIDMRSAGDLARADLTALIARDAVFCAMDLRGVRMAAGTLAGADLRFCGLEDADLRGTDLSGARLCNARLAGARLRSLVMEGGRSIGSRLTGSDLRFADLRGVDLRGADLREADLSHAVLRGADLRGADLRDATLEDPACAGARVDETTRLPQR